MTENSLLLQLVLIITCIVIVLADTNVTTLKKRRGRPRKVTTPNNDLEKVTTDAPQSTKPTSIPTGPTKVTFNEYETFFDSSGDWNPAKKLYPNVTTKKRRKFPTTLFPTSTRFLDDTAEKYTLQTGVTSRLEALYYSNKQHYMKPENIVKADHVVRDMIKKYDEKKGVKNDYTWVSIEQKAQGSLKNKEVREMSALKDVSDL